MRHFKKTGRLTALLLSLALTLTLCLVPARADSDAPLTRAEARDILLSAADDYNPGVTAEDVLQGRPGGVLDEEEPVTRVEALVMLSRAFGTLPELKGANALTAFSSPDFTDVPAWAEEELEPLFNAGIVTGTASGSLSPDSPMTRSDLELLLKRVYSLEGSRLQDDFYAAVNHDWLETAAPQPGYSRYGTLQDVDYNTMQQVLGLIEGIVDGQPQDGTPQDRIKTLYENILDWDSRNAQGVAPIKEYLDALDRAATLDELMAAHNMITEKLAIPTLIAFTPTTDIYHAGNMSVAMYTYAAAMDVSYYADPAACAAFADYVSTLFTLAGYSQERSEQAGERCLALETEMAAAGLTAEEATDVNNTYVVVDAAQLSDMFSEIDLDAVLKANGLTAEDSYVVSDMGLVEYLGQLFTDEHLDDVKLLAEASLLASCAQHLSRDFVDAEDQFKQSIQGVSPTPDQETAVNKVQDSLYNDLGPIYVESCFSSQAKADVTAMVEDIVEVYSQRIRDLDWMSSSTKDMALKKLEAIEINVGYPDQWNNCLDGVDFRSTDEGGSYFENSVQISLAQRSYNNQLLSDPSLMTAWNGVPAYMVNAFYDPTCNAVVLPAGILQAPVYDVNAGAAENLGGIGYVIAHEITHAFDNQGAMFDAEGSLSNWWTDADYAAFQSLCQQVEEFYDGRETAPGIACNGALTLSENVADLGAAACITQVLSGEDDPDYQALYRQVAVLWRSTATRDAMTYLATIDTHSPDKLRVNIVLQSLDQFYEAFDIQPGDGMWIDPQERVSIW